MAAKLTKRQATTAVSAIQTSMLIKALGDHVANKRDMLPTQIKAAEILLRKTVPDLKQVDLQGNLEVNATWTVKFG